MIYADGMTDIALTGTGIVSGGWEEFAQWRRQQVRTESWRKGKSLAILAGDSKPATFSDPTSQKLLRTQTFARNRESRYFPGMPNFRPAVVMLFFCDVFPRDWGVDPGT